MSKKVISFSLYGKNPEYTLGAVDNVRHARWVFPGWICRLYVADDVPQGIVSRLRDYGAEIINMGGNFNYEASLWRFLVAIDPEVDISIVRDTDSRFSKYELKMVNEWLASGKKFHVMYPFGTSYPMMAGMWGVRGTVPELKEPLEKLLQSPDLSEKEDDQTFLHRSLYPLTKGDVYVHGGKHGDEQRSFYASETIQPFRSFWGNQWYVRTGNQRRVFIALSIYKNIPFYEYFLNQFIGVIENRSSLYLFNRRTSKISHLKARFYVADDIRPDLVERLRRLGKVILKPAKTVHKDDPQYWKLSILSEKDLGLAVMVGFWRFFFLVRVAREGFNLIPITYNFQLKRVRNQFRILTPLGVCGPDVPVAQIDELVAQRNPNDSYQKFVQSRLYPRIATVATKVILNAHPPNIGVLRGWIVLLCHPTLYDAMSRFKKSLKNLF